MQFIKFWCFSFRFSKWCVQSRLFLACSVQSHSFSTTIYSSLIPLSLSVQFNYFPALNTLFFPFLDFPQYVLVLCNVSLVVSLYYFPSFTFSQTKIEKEEKYPNLVFLFLKEENNCKNVPNIFLWEKLIPKCHNIHVENP